MPEMYKFRYIGGRSCDLHTGLSNGQTEFHAGEIYETDNYDDLIRISESREFEIIHEKVEEPVVEDVPEPAVDEKKTKGKAQD